MMFLVFARSVAALLLCNGLLVGGLWQETVPGTPGDFTPQQEPAEIQEATPSSETDDVADDSAWLTNADDAVKKAESNQRDLLVVYTGSDWCQPCMQLEQNVLGTSTFVSEAAQRFVLLRLDFPRNVILDEAQKAQNEEWAKRFGVQAFPTLILLDPEQRPYAITGFRDEPSEAYLQHLQELQTIRETRDTFLQQAQQAEGLERATLLDQALDTMDPEIANVYYGSIRDEIGELDRNDEAGLRTKYFSDQDREQREAILANLAILVRLQDPSEAIASIDAAMEEMPFPIELWLRAQRMKLRLLRQLGDVTAAHDLLDEMIAAEGIDPEERQRLITNKAFSISSNVGLDPALEFLEEHLQSISRNIRLFYAKGQLLGSALRHEEAVAIYDRCLTATISDDQLMIEIVGSKADALFALGKSNEAIQVLDDYANNEVHLAKLRAEALLHKSLFLREMGKRRAATLSENRGLELLDSAQEKAEFSNLIEQLRRKYSDPS